MTQILDPADRVADRAFSQELDSRYLDPPLASVPEFDSRYANVCDLVVQLLWPEKYGTAPVDPDFHTSDPARTIARLFFTAAGIVADE